MPGEDELHATGTTPCQRGAQQQNLGSSNRTHCVSLRRRGHLFVPPSYLAGLQDCLSSVFAEKLPWMSTTMVLPCPTLAAGTCRMFGP